MDLRAEVTDWPVGRVAVAVVGPEGVLDRFETDGGNDTFWWASVTKLMTALTVLDACADETLTLDLAVGPPGATVAHLLAHASGLPFEEGAPVSAPGSERLYSNYGFEVVAAALAERAGGPFYDELQGRVLAPLGMTRTVVDGSAAKDAAGPLDDLIKLANEFLRPTVIGPEIVKWATSLAFPGLSGFVPGFGRHRSNDWGLGCEIRDHKSPHWTSPNNSPETFGHFGQSGSFLWVDPRAQLACVSLSDTRFGPWARTAWPRLSTAVLRSYAG